MDAIDPERTLVLRLRSLAAITEIAYANTMPHVGARDLTRSCSTWILWEVHMAERAKGSGPEWNGLRTEPVTSFFDTSRSTSGDQFHLPSQPNSDQPSDLISNRDTDLVLSEPKSLMALLGESTSYFDTSRSTSGDQFHLPSQPNSDQPSDLISNRELAESETMMSLLGDSDGYENAREHWESDRYRRKKWSIAAKMTVIASVALVATASAMAIRLGYFENNRPLADATARQIVVSKQTATETAPAVARQSAETLPASAEQNRPRNPANGLNSGLTPDDTAADTKSVGRGQNAPPLAPAATRSPARLIDKEELASLLKRGRYLLSIGDIAPARLLLERAADAHDASAAFDLAGTYDPAVLTRSHVSGIAPDLAMARMWYEKALNLGHSEAQQRLAKLQK
jgi:hypothetical protein